MITTKHLSHILEPTPAPKEQNQRRRTLTWWLLQILYRIAWSATWLILIAAALIIAGALTHFLAASFTRGWDLL
jgi:hypothetical protein